MQKKKKIFQILVICSAFSIPLLTGWEGKAGQDEEDIIEEAAQKVIRHAPGIATQYGTHSKTAPSDLMKEINSKNPGSTISSCSYCDQIINSAGRNIRQAANGGSITVAESKRLEASMKKQIVEGIQSALSRR